MTSDGRTTDDDWYSNDTATFGDRLADARQAVGMSQEDLARRLGIKLKTLTAWENDLSEPRANRLNMLAGLLNVSFRWLLTGEGEGLQGPFEAPKATPEVHEILTELRHLQGQLVQTADRVGHLEKRLKLALAAAE
ncbi:helix-turn-helix domain-containing protein [Rhodobacteraceae bacterium CCMM004]|nr:helix-turn-helix domain-containing protein [Rhodobacteraceae bacterium CCMM004]